LRILQTSAKFYALIQGFIKLGQPGVRFLPDGDGTNNQVVVFEFLIPPGAKVLLFNFIFAF
jgi:hypothetical protein